MFRTMSSISALKRTAVTQLLDVEAYIMVVVNPATAGVRLPRELLSAGEPIALNVGYRMAVPIPDLRVDEEALRGTLSFSRSPFYCEIPWAAVMQLSVGDEHVVWVNASADPAQKSQPKAKGRPNLRLV